MEHNAPSTQVQSWSQTRAYCGRRSSRDACRTGRLLGRRRKRRSAASYSRKRCVSLAWLHRRRRWRLPTPPGHCASAHDGFHQGRAREFAAADRLDEDTAMLRPSGAHLHRMFHRVLWAVHTVVTPGRFDRSNLTQEPPKTAMSGEELCQAVREDAVTCLQPLLKERSYRHVFGVPRPRLR